MSKLFHYTGCGLRNIYLRNGYEIKDTPYGKTVAIHNLEGLHRAIGLNIVRNKPKLSGGEIRFLRKELDLSQKVLADFLGVSENSVRGWENNRGKITKAPERVLRLIYCEFACEKPEVKNLIERISQLSRDIHYATIEFEETNSGWSTAA